MERADLERQRCVQIVELAMLEATPEQERILFRIRNLIASGGEPTTFREQVESDLAEMRGRVKRAE